VRRASSRGAQDRVAGDVGSLSFLAQFFAPPMPVRAVFRRHEKHRNSGYLFINMCAYLIPDKLKIINYKIFATANIIFV
jgi:hypothetical protein